jgi:hypothetical protein
VEAGVSKKRALQQRERCVQQQDCSGRRLALLVQPVCSASIWTSCTDAQAARIMWQVPLAIPERLAEDGAWQAAADTP